MAHDEPTASGAPSKLVVKNIGLTLSGDIANPILDADAIVAIDGRITQIGRAKDVDAEGATILIDANGVTLSPGLIDSHVHPVAGDWTPRPGSTRLDRFDTAWRRHDHGFQPAKFTRPAVPVILSA